MDEEMIVEHRKGVTGHAQLAYLLLSIFIMCLLASVFAINKCVASIVKTHAEAVLFETLVKHWHIASRNVEWFPILHPGRVETDRQRFRFWNH